MNFTLTESLQFPLIHPLSKYEAHPGRNQICRLQQEIVSEENFQITNRSQDISATMM